MVEVKKVIKTTREKVIKCKYDIHAKPNKKSKNVVCWRCYKIGQVKRDCLMNLDNNDIENNGGGNSGFKPSTALK